MIEPTTTIKQALIKAEIAGHEQLAWKLRSVAKAYAEAGLADQAKPLAEKAAEMTRVSEVLQKQLAALDG